MILTFIFSSSNDIFSFIGGALLELRLVQRVPELLTAEISSIRDFVVALKLRRSCLTVAIRLVSSFEPNISLALGRCEMRWNLSPQPHNLIQNVDRVVVA